MKASDLVEEVLVNLATNTGEELLSNEWSEELMNKIDAVLDYSSSSKSPIQAAVLTQIALAALTKYFGGLTEVDSAFTAETDRCSDLWAQELEQMDKDAVSVSEPEFLN